LKVEGLDAKKKIFLLCDTRYLYTTSVIRFINFHAENAREDAM